MQVCLNGHFIAAEQAKLSISDGGFLFGDTLFETFKAQGQKILLSKEHLDRLELSAKLLDFPCNRKQIELSLQQLAAQLTTPVSRIRLTISRGDHQGLTLPAPDQGWFLLTAVPYDEPSDQERQAGADCVLAPNQRVNPLSHLPQMKRGNYADCLYAANYAQQKGAREALFVDAGGNVLEGCTSNIFAVIDDQLVTPPTGTLILAGVMRRQILAAANEIGLKIAEETLPLVRLRQADEIFLSNSLIEILPVNYLDGQVCKRGGRWRSLLARVNGG
ncbi:MAG TPA: aminotransferase class IV [Malonomonas sp.]